MGPPEFNAAFHVLQESMSCCSHGITSLLLALIGGLHGYAAGRSPFRHSHGGLSSAFHLSQQIVFACSDRKRRPCATRHGYLAWLVQVVTRHNQTFMAYCLPACSGELDRHCCDAREPPHLDLLRYLGRTTGRHTCQGSTKPYITLATSSAFALLQSNRAEIKDQVKTYQVQSVSTSHFGIMGR